MTGPPSDRELVEALGGRVDGHEVVEIVRRPYRYATSAPLEEVRMTLGDGEEATMILKDLDRERLLGDARTSKPPVLYEPLREIETYRRIIGPAGIGPRLYASASGGEPRRVWLLIEKVPGVELWQVGEIEVWEGVARWLGRMHARFHGRDADLLRVNSHLLAHTREWYEWWRDRALAAASAMEDPRAPALRQALRAYAEVAGRLAELPRTLIHGEMYPANVLVIPDREAPAIYPVDWEMAGVGPGAIDIAALAAGWDADAAGRLERAYAAGVGAVERVQATSALADDIRRARLHLALQWLGWAEGWKPPREHANDWLAEALRLARELGLAPDG